VDQTPTPPTPPTPQTPDPANNPTPIPFDASLEHHNKPRVRPIQAFPVKQGEQMMLGLGDPQKISSRVIFASPVIQHLLPAMNGLRDVQTIVDEIGHGLTRETLESLISQLDTAGLLEGPNFEKLLSEMRAEFDESPVLPPASTSMFADALVAEEIGESVTPEQKIELGGKKLAEAFDAWISQSLKPVEDPSFNALPRAIFVPHLDYPRGWHNYSQAYGRLRVVDRPTRIVILGTNHFGMGTGVVGCDKGYETPIGTCPLDEDFLVLLNDKLGTENSEKLLANRYDHEREHSIELHIPWIQHIFGADASGNHVPVFSALVHDPVRNNGESYDGTGLALEPFVEALKSAIGSAEGSTLIVASADLSHVGPAFGDQQKLTADESDAQAKEFRDKVIKHDQDMLKLVTEAKGPELVSSLAWQQNPTRWCSVGNITATLMATDAEKVRLLSYAGAGDQNSGSMVTSFAGVID